MEAEEMGRRAGEALEAVRTQRPLVHNITNLAVMNQTANALLACGAAPVMAHAPEEVEQMVSLAGALVLNIGTLTPGWVEAMLKAGRRANELEIPIVFDPVGAGATQLRTDAARRIMSELQVEVVCGNASEVLALAGQRTGVRWVDTHHTVEEASGTAHDSARSTDAVFALTGPEDLVTDGGRSLRVANGHRLMGRVSGIGCSATALIGAFLAVEPHALVAATSALAYLGLAGEHAAAKASGPGSFSVGLFDALYNIDSAQLAAGARITER